MIPLFLWLKMMGYWVEIPTKWYGIWIIVDKDMINPVSVVWGKDMKRLTGDELNSLRHDLGLEFIVK